MSRDTRITRKRKRACESSACCGAEYPRGGFYSPADLKKDRAGLFFYARSTRTIVSCVKGYSSSSEGANGNNFSRTSRLRAKQINFARNNGLRATVRRVAISGFPETRFDHGDPCATAYSWMSFGDVLGRRIHIEQIERLVLALEIRHVTDRRDARSSGGPVDRVDPAIHHALDVAKVEHHRRDYRASALRAK